MYVATRGLGTTTFGKPFPATPFPFVVVFLAAEALGRGLALGLALPTKCFDSMAVVPLGAVELRRFPVNGIVAAIGVEPRLFDLVCLEDFLGGFLAALFAADLLAAFLAFFTVRLLSFAAFFGADVLAGRFDLAACLPPFFLTDFLLAFATTISFIAQTRLLGDDRQRSA